MQISSIQASHLPVNMGEYARPYHAAGAWLSTLPGGTGVKGQPVTSYTAAQAITALLSAEMGIVNMKDTHDLDALLGIDGKLNATPLADGAHVIWKVTRPNMMFGPENYGVAGMELRHMPGDSSDSPLEIGAVTYSGRYQVPRQSEIDPILSNTPRSDLRKVYGEVRYGLNNVTLRLVRRQHSSPDGDGEALLVRDDNSPLHFLGKSHSYSTVKDGNDEYHVVRMNEEPARRSQHWYGQPLRRPQHWYGQQPLLSATSPEELGYRVAEFRSNPNNAQLNGALWVMLGLGSKRFSERFEGDEAWLESELNAIKAAGYSPFTLSETQKMEAAEQLGLGIIAAKRSGLPNEGIEAVIGRLLGLSQK